MNAPPPLAARVPRPEKLFPGELQMSFEDVTALLKREQAARVTPLKWLLALGQPVLGALPFKQKKAIEQAVADRRFFTAAGATGINALQNVILYPLLFLLVGWLLLDRDLFSDQLKWLIFLGLVFGTLEAIWRMREGFRGMPADQIVYRAAAYGLPLGPMAAPIIGLVRSGDQTGSVGHDGFHDPRFEERLERERRYGEVYRLHAESNGYLLEVEFPRQVPASKIKEELGMPNEMPDYDYDLALQNGLLRGQRKGDGPEHAPRRRRVVRPFRPISPPRSSCRAASPAFGTVSTTRRWKSLCRRSCRNAARRSRGWRITCLRPRPSARCGDPSRPSRWVRRTSRRTPAREALRQAGMGVEDVEFIVFATMTPDVTFPGAACYFQDKLGCGTVGALDIRGQCAGFLYGLMIADGFLRGGNLPAHRPGRRRGALLRARLLRSRHARRVALRRRRRGRGARKRERTRRACAAVVCHADGRHHERFWCEYPASRQHPLRITVEDMRAGRHFPSLDFDAVAEFGRRHLPAVIGEALARAGAASRRRRLLRPRPRSSRRRRRRPPGRSVFRRRDGSTPARCTDISPRRACRSL